SSDLPVGSPGQITNGAGNVRPGAAWADPRLPSSGCRPRGRAPGDGLLTPLRAQLGSLPPMLHSNAPLLGIHSHDQLLMFDFVPS
ncbi:MAG: hypothetical protein AB7U18_22660, partial [Dehalococcoidia bacterium]